MSDETSTRRVFQAIARHLGVDAGALRGRDRTLSMVQARWVAVVILRERCGLSFRQLGALLRRSAPGVFRGHRRALRLREMQRMIERVDRMMRLETEPPLAGAPARTLARSGSGS